MRLFRSAMMMLGLAILLVNTGDCVSLAFADAKTADCCLMADCPLAGAPQMDACCKTPTPAGKYIQAAQQHSISKPTLTYVDFPPARLAGEVEEIARMLQEDSRFHAPPGRLRTLFTPLLI